MTTTTTHSAKVTLPADDQILITREFAASKHLVFRAYTEPELIKQWWAGDRGEVTAAEVDLRVGGRWRYVMTAGPGFEVAFSGEYREIVAAERLVNTEIYEAMPDNPSLVTVSFTEVDGRTTLTMLSEYDSKATRDAVLESGMESGMQEGMDKLEQLAAALA